LMRRFVPLEGTDTPEDTEIAQLSGKVKTPDEIAQQQSPLEPKPAKRSEEQLVEAEAPSRVVELQPSIEAEVHSGRNQAHTKTSSKRRIARRHKALSRYGPKGRIVVPKALIRDVLNVFHGIPLTGHLGKDKTVQTIGQYFYWKGLTTDVAHRVKGCHVCQMRKPTRPMRHMHPGGFSASEPMKLLVIDCVTKLPESDGNVLLLTCVDVFTKLVIAIPLPNEKSETVGRALQQRLFSVHSYPRLLLSDRAKGFVSDGLKWLCKHLGIVKVNTTGLLPTGASPVERFHRGLGASLTMICNKAKNDWAFLVDSVTFAYKISVNESTG
jgi:hypothetical protein